MKTDNSFRILLVEDNPADVRLTQEALRASKFQYELFVVSDGEETLEFLNRRGSYTQSPRPDLILLDLNLPRKDGRVVLAEIKSDPRWMGIPVVILTTSQSEADILDTYNNHANGYIVKPVDWEQFITVIKRIEQFWMSIVMLPNKRSN